MNLIEVALKRDRQIVVGALVLVVFTSWAYLLSGAGMGMSAWEMTRNTMPLGTGEFGMGDTMSIMSQAVWTPSYAVLMFFMWWIMMIGMMLPSAAPMIVLHVRVQRRAAAKRGQGADGTGSPPYASSLMFMVGYLAVWAGFSLIATAAQWSLNESGLLSSLMASTSVFLGSGLLMAAGVWQVAPLKQACLRHCRSPLQFLSSNWRDGVGGAFRMGLQHGAYCVGCCWVLMGLLFYGGVMNLYWIAGLALFVLLEKTVPAGHWLACGSGIALMASGVGLLVMHSGQ